MAGGDVAKADQIAFHIYTKLWHVVNAARTNDNGVGRTDKWFNLDTPITSTPDLDAYRSISAGSAPRPLTIQVVLAVPPPGGGTALVHAPTSTRIEPEPRFVLLEEWTLACSPVSDSSSTQSSSTDDNDILPPTIYKNSIPLFRAIYALLRILPAWRTVLKLGKRRGTGKALRVMVRLRPDDEPRGTVLEFGQSMAPETSPGPLPTNTHIFPGIAHPAGTLSLSTTYLTTPSFSLESLETLLSSRFAVLDARPRPGGVNVPVPPLVGRTSSYTPSPTSGPSRMPLGAARPRSTEDNPNDEDDDFMPTLARRSVSVSTTSFPSGGQSPSRYTSPLPLPGTSASPGRYTPMFHNRQRTESTRSQTPSTSYSSRMGVNVQSSGAGYRRDTADIDRFVLPAGSPGSGPPSAASGHTRADSSTSTELSAVYGRAQSEREREREREKGVPIGGARSSGGAGLGLSGVGVGSLPGSAPSPSPVNPNMINPFKSNTLSKSSLTGSLLRGVSGSPGRQGVAFPQPQSSASEGIATSSSGLAGTGGLPGSSSPGAGGTGSIPVPPQRKRYSSSFSHRYGAGAAAGSSVGSGGSAESGSQSGGGSFGVGLAGAAAARERERERRGSGGGASAQGGSRSGSFLKSASSDPQQRQQQQDDIDISVFVKDLEAAPRLSGRYREQQEAGDEEGPEGGDEPPRPQSHSRTGSASSSPGTSRDGTIRGSGSTAHPSRSNTMSSITAAASATAAADPMLTSASDVEDQLQRMNEQFKRSLAGLGSGRGRGQAQRSPVGALFTSSSGSTSTSASGSGIGSMGQGSDEVIGRMEFDFEPGSRSRSSSRAGRGGGGSYR
ncbi:Autophagy-related protein 13 [Mycena kentingensis (nom. inval.)]|nr:Autophagy-related protein 13 [Mycena kentingensis (nom. inval.)]